MSPATVHAGHRRAATSFGTPPHRLRALLALTIALIAALALGLSGCSDLGAFLICRTQNSMFVIS